MKTKHLQTKDFLFLVDTETGDGVSDTEMYNKEGYLISDNFLASDFLFEILLGETDEEIIFISPEMEYNRRELLKQDNNK